MKDAGLTLIEVLVAIAMLAVVTVSILTLLPGLARTNVQTRDEQRVALAAKAYFETVRSEFARLPSGFETDPTTLDVPGVGNGLSCTKAAAENLHTRTVKTSAGTSTQAILKRVKLTCTMNSKEYKFALDLARPGL